MPAAFRPSDAAQAGQQWSASRRACRVRISGDGNTDGRFSLQYPLSTAFPRRGVYPFAGVPLAHRTPGPRRARGAARWPPSGPASGSGSGPGRARRSRRSPPSRPSGGGRGAAAESPGVPASGSTPSASRAPSAPGAGPPRVSRDLPEVARYLVTPRRGATARSSTSRGAHRGGRAAGGDGGHAGGGAPDQGHLPRLRPGRPPRAAAAPAAHAGEAGRRERLVGELRGRLLPVEFRSEVQRADVVEVEGRRYKVWVIRDGGRHRRSPSGHAHRHLLVVAGAGAARCGGRSTWRSGARRRWRPTPT